MIIFKFLLAVLIVSLFIYSKVGSFENQISEKYLKIFTIIKSIFKPVLNFLKTLFKPYKIGVNLFIDTSQIVLLILLLIIILNS